MATPTSEETDVCLYRYSPDYIAALALSLSQCSTTCLTNIFYGAPAKQEGDGDVFRVGGELPRDAAPAGTPHEQGGWAENP